MMSRFSLCATWIRPAAKTPRSAWTPGMKTRSSRALTRDAPPTSTSMRSPRARTSRPYNSILSPRGIHNHFPAWRNYREYSGGMMTDWGAHHFDIAQWGLGMDESGPVEVIPPSDPKAEYGVRYIYASGVEMIHGTYKAPDGKDRDGIHFIGENGIVHVNRGQLESWPGEIVKTPLGASQKPRFKSPGHHQNWFDCIKSRERAICDVEIGARSVTVCHLGNLAYWYGRK